MNAFLYFKRSRALHAFLFVLALLFAPFSARAETEIRSLTGIIEGHQVGGIDFVGNIYVADFGDLVWKITPEGERYVFASGLHGASGNAIDSEGNLLPVNRTNENKMKTTLTLITVITSLFFSACANNNRAEYWNPRPAPNAHIPPNQGAQLQINLMRDQFTKTMCLPSDGHDFGL